MLMTKGNLLNAKSSLKLAKMGYELMDRKHIILMRELSEMLEDASILRQKIDSSYERAYLALQKANITMGKVAQLSDRMPLDNEIDIKFRSVMGVEIPKVSMVSSKRHFPYSLSQSNSRLDEAYLEMQKVKENTVKLAQIDVGMFRLAKAIQTSRKRANALKGIVIPNLENTIKLISDDLEEKERESFIRMKLVKKQKNKSAQF